MNRQAKEFSSPAELKEYLHEHPGADAHKSEMSRAKGQDRKDLKALHDKLKGEMHKEAHSKVALNVLGRFVASRL